MNYPSFAGIFVTTLLIAVPFVGFFALVVDVVMVLRYVFGYRAPGSATWSIHHPSVKSLVVVWIVAVTTVVAYPLAFYMTWRFFAEGRRRSLVNTKVCPRCAETVKALALVCRHCGQQFDVSPSESAAPIGVPPGGSGMSDLATNVSRTETSDPGTLRVALLVVGLPLVVIASLAALVFLGSQVNAPAIQSVAPPPCVIVADGPLGKMAWYLPGATVAQCGAELASARENFGPDSSSSKLYIVHDVPSGTPACVVGIARVFTYGLTADALAQQICP